MTTPPYHKLLCAAVANSTHAAYTTAYNRFEHWIQRPISSLPNPDVTLSEYFAHLESSGESQHTARKTLYALLHFHPHLAGRLPTAHRCLRGFSNLRPTGVQHPPLPWHIAHGVAFVLASQGVPAAAIAVLLSHHTLLRISEVVAIRAGDFRYTHTPATPLHLRQHVLHLPRTKTGLNQSCLITDTGVSQLVLTWCASKAPNDKVFPFSANRLRCLFKRACAVLGLPSSVVFHSLRHGGATEAVLKGVPLPVVRRMGRWKQDSSLDRYVQVGPVTIMSLNLSPFGSRLVQSLRGVSPMKSISLALSQSH